MKGVTELAEDPGILIPTLGPPPATHARPPTTALTPLYRANRNRNGQTARLPGYQAVVLCEASMATFNSLSREHLRAD